MEIAERAVPAAATLITFTTLSLLVVLLRLYTRTFIVKNVGADDYLIIASMVSCTFPFGIQPGVPSRKGRHADTQTLLRLDQLRSWLSYSFVSRATYNRPKATADVTVVLTKSQRSSLASAGQ